MGIKVSVCNFEQPEGQHAISRRKYKRFPTKNSAGKIVLKFKALPKERQLRRDPTNLMWWVDIDWKPYTDDEMVVSVGAYQERAGRTPVSVNPLVQGLISQVYITPTKIGYKMLKGTDTSSRPNVTYHPGGEHIGYAGCGCLCVTDLSNHLSIRKPKELRNNTYRCCALAPNGRYMASLAKCFTVIELSLHDLDATFATMAFTIHCHDVCTGFRARRDHTDHFECKFSPDSSLIAVAHSDGLLFVVKKIRLLNHCVIIPGIIPDRLPNERCIDFDPRYYDSSRLAFSTNNSEIHFCDLDTLTLDNEPIHLDVEGTVTCIKFAPRGKCLAVATSESEIHLYDPDAKSLLQTLDGASQDAALATRGGLYQNFPTTIRLCFSSLGEHLAMSSTDGYVRIWQLQFDLSLQNLCRLSIIEYVAGTDIKKLPLPPKVISYLHFETFQSPSSGDSLEITNN